MTIAEFDHLDLTRKKELLSQCCGSSTWVEKMLAAPWAEDLVDLEEIAEEKWYECTETDWREAFDHHPKIGDKSLSKNVDNNHSKNNLWPETPNNKDWAIKEQSGVNDAAEIVLYELAKYNEEYQQKFSYIFIICATGKSANEMLGSLKLRLLNSTEEEIKIAAEEQLEITKLRLEKLFL